MLFRPRTLGNLRCPAAWFHGVVTAVGLLTFTLTQAADIDPVQKLYINGQYETALKQASAGAQEHPRDEDWPILESKALLTLGHYPEALTCVSNALTRMPWSIRIRVAARDAYLQNGQPAQAKLLVEEINDRATTRTYAYRDSANVIALGQAALLLGADARKVLDNFFNRVKKADPANRDAYLAIGQLAIDKYDYDMAAKTFQEALERFADDPDMLYGLAKSYSTGDRAQMLPLLEKVLEHNERHVPALLLLADHLVDAEEYKKADELLDKALAVNPRHPEAWAYRAVLAHLRNKPDDEKTARDKALSSWKSNPRVDYILGLKLSQKYRFAEGSAYQRQALRSDPDYLPAKGQLAQDLLRLGQEEEGWALAEEVYKQDGYDVGAYNLVTLHDNLAKFQSLTNADFKVRMQPKEAAVYGERVTNLLERARIALCKKYGLDLTNQVVVEIFPEQKDFAVRTFGMPGGEGFLGVCFGNVITANSPASQAAHVVNWEAVLWHEFCHVVTLGLTHNKMPRWLSEGISVYEERQANPAWGQGMNPRYRQMILKGELTPVGNLSAAFLAPKTPMHLQFAYYESSLVVEFLVDHFGLDGLRKLLRDLANGKSINQAIEDNTQPLTALEKEFAAFVKQRAEQLGGGLDWEEPPEDLLQTEGAHQSIIPPLVSGGRPGDKAKAEESWMERHPNNIWTLTQKAKKLVAEKKWAEAKVPLEKLLQAYPENTGPGNPYLLLAQVYRGLNEPDQERAILGKLARLENDAIDAYSRLMELDTAAKDWPGVARNAQRFLAVNPLVPQPYRFLAQASEEAGKDRDAMQAYGTLLLLDPPDPADVHYRLARLLHKEGDPAAKRHVLQALEEAPRFRDAHRLLLQLSQSQPASSTGSSPGSTVTP
jgi:tetratricopeptide (TPR) repeat protein